MFRALSLIKGTFSLPTVATATTHNVLSLRHSSTFFTRLTAKDLWKGVSSVSNAGRKRGRARGLMKPKDLNRGQYLGEGAANMRWPGLNAPIIRDRQVVQRVQLPPDPERQEKLNTIRDSHKIFRANKLTPLERGWTGGKMGGRKAGPPDPYEGETYENFESIILEFKFVDHMTGNMGRKRAISCMVVTGNRNGVFGVGRAKAGDGRTAIRKAKNRAGHSLRYFEPCDGHTIYHDFHANIINTLITCRKMPKGSGLECNRVIKAICELIGIEDIQVKIVRGTNPLNMTKAFLKGLEYQLTPQELADKAGSYLVELRDDRENFPHLVAAPRTEENSHPPEYYSFLLDGKVEWVKPTPVPFYVRDPAFKEAAERKDLFRNNHITAAKLEAMYGSPKRFFLHDREDQIGKEQFEKECMETMRLVCRPS